MRTRTLLLLCLIISFYVNAQTEFFNSNLQMDAPGTEDFYSSVTVDKNTVYFIADNYTLYAFDKASGQKKWDKYLRWKTNRPVYIAGDTLITGHSDERKDAMSAFIDAKTGNVLKRLPFGPIHTKPYFKNGIMYSTAIYEGGQILAYDIKKDTVVWGRFVAHGMDTEPIYLNKKIQVNAEGTNWFEIDYNNSLLKKCGPDAEYEDDSPCMENYWFLTHDGKQISDEFLEKNLGQSQKFDFYTTKENTFILGPDNLLIVGNKTRVKDDVSHNDITGDIITEHYNDYFKILKADDKHVWYISNSVLLQYSIKEKKAVKTYILEKWMPHQAVLDGNNVWVINANDGQLYGIKLN